MQGTLRENTMIHFNLNEYNESHIGLCRDIAAEPDNDVRDAL